MLFQLINITKEFDQEAAPVPALRGVSFTVNVGETIGIIGASGAGKSTLLNIMGTLDQPTSGRVLWKGEDLVTLSEAERCRLRNRSFGFVFQFHHLLPDFTAIENVTLPLLIRGIGKKEAASKAARALHQVALEARTGHQPAQLSGGEQQRVAIARAIVAEPEIIFADEPTGNLDGPTGDKIFDLLLRLNREINTTFIFVTHNLSLTPKLNRVIHLVDGKIHTS